MPTIKTNTSVPIRGLHHWAYRCRDAEETRHFYEDILGLPLAPVIQADYVPSTGEYCRYVHLFFRLLDGSYVAFFDLGDGGAAEPSPNTPSWANHLALRVDSERDLSLMKARLTEHGMDVLGITDHGFVKSIYFFDPNGVRLELTADSVGNREREGFEKTAHDELAKWSAQKRTPGRSASG